MDALLAILPEINYWVIACAVLAFLNIYQFAIAHKLAGKVVDMLDHGHAPEGKVLVPAEAVVVTPPAPATPTPVEHEPPTPGANGTPGLFSLQVTGTTDEDMAAIMAKYFNRPILDSMRSPHRDGAPTIEPTTGVPPP